MYKRQGLHRSVLQEFVKSGEMYRFGRGLYVRSSAWAVSYTHLDVYKRQGNHIAALTECAFPVCNVWTRTVGTPFGVAERTDHRVNIKIGVIVKLLGVSAY